MYESIFRIQNFMFLSFTGSQLAKKTWLFYQIYKKYVGFDEAQTIFTDDLSVIKPDVEHSNTEERLLIIGTSNKNRLIVVSYTEREDIIRLINARKATRNERKQYEED